MKFLSSTQRRNSAFENFSVPFYFNSLITREPLIKRPKLFKVFKGYFLEYLPTSSKSGLSTLRNSEFSLHMIVAVLLMLWSKASSPKASPSDISPTT